MVRFAPALLIGCFCVTLPVLSSAHELWVEPETWQVAEGETIRADLRNGEEFSGSRLSWFDRSVARADLAIGETLQQITARMGDRPAMQAEAFAEGLAVVIHETTPSKITYKTWEKFQKFVDHKALPVTRAAHEAAGHPAEGFAESYTRHAKALVAVGDGGGSDRAFGLQTELVALENPYTETFGGEMRVRLLYQGQPRKGAQVEIFDRAPDDTVTIRLTTTDDKGEALIPVTRGHTYLLDAVLLRPGSVDGALYDTLWAALAFHVPN